jgi:nitrogen fixation-related uncharacterized protein
MKIIKSMIEKSFILAISLLMVIVIVLLLFFWGYGVHILVYYILKLTE